MRAHGVPGYPDPNGAGEVSLGSIDVASGTFLAAARVCARNLPYMNLPPPDPKDTARLIAQDVRFAACMHRHAFPQYPEPQLVHGRDLLQLGGPGMNMSSPPFKRAVERCSSIWPGAMAALSGS